MSLLDGRAPLQRSQRVKFCRRRRSSHRAEFGPPGIQPLAAHASAGSISSASVWAASAASPAPCSRGSVSR